MANAILLSSADAVVATVPAVEGNVNVISDVDAGPISVTLFVPLSLSSKNSINPADVEPFLTETPASKTGLPLTVSPVSVPTEVTFVWAAVCRVADHCVAVNLPVLGL